MRPDKLTDPVVFEGSTFLILSLQERLHRHKYWPHGARYDAESGEYVRTKSCYRLVRGGLGGVATIGREIKEVIVHHTGGSIVPVGPAGPMSVSAYCVTDPKPSKYVHDGKPDQRYGRSWPGICYHAWIPYAPETVEVLGQDDDLHPILVSKHIIYECWTSGWWIYNTAGRNAHCYGIGLQGSFSHRPGGEPGEPREPSVLQMELLATWWEEWAKPTLRLEDRDLYGHADYGKPTCPGITAYSWLRSVREMQADPPVELPPES